MFKRSFALLFMLLLTALSAGMASAQAPFVSITSPGSGTVISNTAAPLNVSVQFGNAPEPDANGGPGLLLRAYDASETTLFTQTATVDLSLIPWSAQLDFAGNNPPLGSTVHLIAFMTDSLGTQIAQSPAIPIVWGSAPIPTDTPTNTPTPTATNTSVNTPTNTPTPTATTPGGQSAISVSVPTANQLVDPIAGFTVTGNTANLPAGATVLVRLRNANGETLGEQGIVPVANQAWTVTLKKTIGNIATTTNGDMFAFLILNGSVIAQTNAIPLTFPGGNQQATLTITVPGNGTVINTSVAVVVSGTSTGLANGTTIQVQGYVSNGPTLVAQGIGQTNNAGNWSATLNFNLAVNPGAGGYITASAIVGGSPVAVSNTVNVTWGSGTIKPFVRINSPQQGAIVGVNGAPVQVYGTAGNVTQNNVTVRALDPFGNVLAQQSTVTDGQGNWQALSLFVNVQPGTPGTLYAFGTNPQNGAVVGSTRIGVTFGGQCFLRTDWPIVVVKAGDTLLRIAQRVGSNVTELAYANCLYNADLVYVGQRLRVPRLPVTPPPQQVTLRIIIPAENAILDTTQPILVTGAGMGIAGNNIVVRALDSSGNLLGQQTVIGGNTQSNGESSWQVSLNVQVASGTPGAIYAFAQSPSSGQILADALASVSFGAPVVVTPAPGEKLLIITSPTADSSVTPSGQLQVMGQLLGPVDGDVYVRLLDNQGNVLSEEQAQVAQADAQGNASWQAVLNINVPAGTRGLIFAYIPSPFDVAAMIADSVNVVFGQADNGPYVTITNPIPYTTLDTTNGITIAGRGGRLFEGNVVVRALDNLGNILAETATTINSPNAGTGGEGDWQANLQVNVAKGTRGSLIALSQSAQDGSIAAFASVYVTYGDPTDTDNFVKINAPLPGTMVDPSQTLMIAGTADRHNGNTVKVQIVDDQGNVLVDQPRNLNPSEKGDFGVWQMLIELKSMPIGTHLRINALTTSKVDGTTLATDSVDIIVGAPSQPSGGS